MRPTLPLSFVLAAALASGAALPTRADAQALTPLDRFHVGIGLFHSRISLDGRVTVDENVLDDVIDNRGRQLTEDFDLDRYRPMRVAEIGWSPWERHEFGLRWYDDRYRRTIQLSDELEFDGEVFPVDVDLRARTRFSAVELDYTWWAFATPRSALGVQLGVMRLTAGLSLDGTVDADDAGAVSVSASASRRLHAPLIGVAGRHMFGDRLRGFAELRAIELGYKRIDGTALSGAAGFDWMFTDHWGLTLQYTGLGVRAKTDRRWVDGRAELKLHGAQLMLKHRW